MKLITTTIIFVILPIFLLGCSVGAEYTQCSYDKNLLDKYNDLVRKYNLREEKLEECYAEQYNLKNKIILNNEKWAEFLWVGAYSFSPSGCERSWSIFTMCKHGCDVRFRCDTSSTLPLFSCKDKLTLAKCSDYYLGDIILFKNKNEQLDYDYLIHQIIEIKSNKFITKGFNNFGRDNFTVEYPDIEGKVISIEYA